MRGHIVHRAQAGGIISQQPLSCHFGTWHSCPFLISGYYRCPFSWSVLSFHVMEPSGWCLLGTGPIAQSMGWGSWWQCWGSCREVARFCCSALLCHLNKLTWLNVTRRLNYLSSSSQDVWQRAVKTLRSVSGFYFSSLRKSRISLREVLSFRSDVWKDENWVYEANLGCHTRRSPCSGVLAAPPA